MGCQERSWLPLLEAIAALNLTLQVEATKMLFFAEQAEARPREDWMTLLEAIAALDLTLQVEATKMLFLRCASRGEAKRDLGCPCWRPLLL